MDHFDLIESHRKVHEAVQRHLDLLGVDYVADMRDLTITVKPRRKKRDPR